MGSATASAAGLEAAPPNLDGEGSGSTASYRSRTVGALRQKAYRLGHERTGIPEHDRGSLGAIRLDPHLDIAVGSEGS